jgi:hypothetical protein
MLTTGLTALALFRFSGGRGFGFFPMLVLLAVVGGIVWALTRPGSAEQPKS